MISKLKWVLALVFAGVMVSLNALAEDGFQASMFGKAIAALEGENGGRLGVAALNMANGERLEYRAEERFAMCSTFKLPLVAAVLSRIDAGVETLDRPVRYSTADIEDYAPIAGKHLKDGEMSVSVLSAAAIEYSDNTAANLLLSSIGGPVGFTRYVRSLGDKVTRLNRNEPLLGTNLPGDVRDTTTPAAMLDTMRKLLVGDALSAASREQLIRWLIDNTTGDARLRAGLNSEWEVGDKTGTGKRGASNDVAIVWPPESPPFLVAVYYSDSTLSPEGRSAVIAEAGRIVSATFYGHQSF